MKKLITFFAITCAFVQAANAWDIDWSRREKYMTPHKPVEGSFIDPTVAAPAREVPVASEKPQTLTPAQISTSYEPAQEIVILNTEKGFIPKSLSLRAGVKYKLNVVNVNEKEKNVSFIMSAFSQFEGTYFGQIKSFEIVPPKEGVYTYECPETSQEGRMVVIPGTSTERALASESK